MSEPNPMTEQTTLYKLMILYMLERVDFPLSYSQISEFILGKGYTSYFTLQASLSELIESGLADQEAKKNTSYYTITPEGSETLGFFTERIGRGIRNDIDCYLRENKFSLRDESSVQSDYYRNTAGEFSVHCTVREKETMLIDLTLSVPTEAQAKAICLQWDKNSQPVYEYLMKTLMK